jgi:hypothetical protein
VVRAFWCSRVEVVALCLALSACSAPNPAYLGVPDGESPAAPDAAPVPDVASDVASAQVFCPQDTTLAVCMLFENAVVDQSPSKLGTTVSGVSYETGPVGLAATLTASSHIQLADSPVLANASITIEVAVKPRTFPTASERAVLVDYSRQYALVMLAGGELRCRVNTGGSSFVELSAGAALKTGMWQSVACSVGGGYFTLWRQGTVLTSVPLSAPLVARSTNEPFLVGRNYPTTANPSEDPFLGAVDNLRIWRRVRTAQEICGGAFDCATR